MRVLVLGGAGFIGLHLARRLTGQGHEVTIADDFSRGRHDPELAALDVPVLHVDLTGSCASIPGGWDQVYMLAAVVGVRNVERDPGRVLRTNTLALLSVLDWIEPGTRLFFASTSEVYAGGVDAGLVPVPTPENVPVVVADVTARRYTYGISKLWGEAAVAHLAAAKSVPYVIGRFHNVYGPRMGTDHVIPELLLRALAGADPFPVYGTEQTRAFCYVDDAVQAMQRLMGAAAALGRTVHIGDDTEETRIGDLADLVLRVVGRDAVVAPLPAPAGSVTRRCPDLGLLRELTGHQPLVPLEEGVRRTLDWYRRTVAPPSLIPGRAGAFVP
jgi:nucleoside-diphosphate-sugar epimerase